MTSNAVQFLLQFFTLNHLHPALQQTVAEFNRLAAYIAAGPDNDETVRALEDLVDAKDHAVRALVADGALRRWDASVEKEQVVAAHAERCEQRLGNTGGQQCERAMGHDGAHRFAA